jgi:hypothetical protein
VSLFGPCYEGLLLNHAKEKFMKISIVIASLTFSAIFSLTVSAQVAPTAGTNHADMLRSADSKIAANKKLVYDFWRTVIEARHVEQAENFVAADYVQHNPNIPTGRQAMIDFFGGKPPREISSMVA